MQQFINSTKSNDNDVILMEDSTIGDETERENVDAVADSWDGVNKVTINIKRN